MKKKKNKSIGRIFTNKKTVKVFILLVFLILLYIIYNLFNKGECEGDDCIATNTNVGSYIWFLFKIILFICLLTIIIPTIIFLIYGKGKFNLKDNKTTEDENKNKDEEDQNESRIPEFNFETSNETSSCPIEHFSTIPARRSAPNVNNNKYIHIDNIPDMKNYVHKKDLPCMSNYIHKKEVPNMSEYIHKTKIPPVKALKKTSELPDHLDTIKLDEIKQIFGIDMNNYILKTAIPQTLKCPDINDYVLKSSVPPF